MVSRTQPQSLPGLSASLGQGAQGLYYNIIQKIHRKPQQKASSGNNEIFKQLCWWQCLFLTGEYCLGEVICTNQWMIDVRPMKDWCMQTQNTSALIESPGFPRIMGGEKNPCLWDSSCHPIFQKFSNLSSCLFLSCWFFHQDYYGVTNCAHTEDLVGSQVGSRVIVEKESSKVRGTDRENQRFCSVL